MRIRGNQGAGRAFSLMELLVAMAIIGILAALLLPATQRATLQAKRVKCAAQLKDLGVAFHAFAHDHQSLFPAHVPVAEGGAREFAAEEFLSGADFSISPRQFQPLARDLSSPRTLACPADLRSGVASFSALTASNLSYLVGLNAEYQTPASALVVDRNLTLANVRSIPPASDGSAVRVAGWSHELHQTRGNVLFADAHVETRTTIEFKRPAQTSSSRPGNWMNPYSYIPRPSYPGGVSASGGPYYPRVPSAAGNGTPTPTQPSYGLFTMLQQPQLVPTPLMRPSIPTPTSAPVSKPQATALKSTPETGTEEASRAKALSVASAENPLATSSGINYWFLFFLLLAALGLRHLLLRTVSGKKGRAVGQALAPGRWSRHGQSR